MYVLVKKKEEIFKKLMLKNIKYYAVKKKEKEVTK